LDWKAFAPFGIKISYTPLGIVVALVFIGFPFVVRTVQPVLESFDVEVEEAAACLGATRFQTFCRVILPELFPALITGFALRSQGPGRIWFSGFYIRKHADENGNNTAFDKNKTGTV